MGVLKPNRAAASKANSPPLKAGSANKDVDGGRNYFTVNRTVMAFLAEVMSAATTLAPGASFTPLASSLSPATTSSASDFSAPLSTVNLPLMPVGAIGLP